MLGNDKKKSITQDEFLSIVKAIESYTSLNDLIVGTSKTFGVKHSFYQYFPAVGSVDFSSAGKFHGYNLPPETHTYFERFKNHDGDPLMTEAFKKGRPIWLSDNLHVPEIIKARYDKVIQAVLKELGDGVCFPLYGPYNRTGYAFAAFGRGKAEFDPIMPYQLHSLLQVMHLRYCLITKGVGHQIRLTPREFEVLELMSFGKTNPEIAIILGISARTVAVHAGKIFIKLGTSDRVSTAMRAQTIHIKV